LRAPGDFAKHLRDLARPLQIEYQRLMAAHGGRPIGIECRSAFRPAWAFVLPEMNEAGRFRVQCFDEDGFFSHQVYDGLEQAIENMMVDGYRTPDVGALDRIAATDRWAMGVKYATLRQRFQEGLITYVRMLEEMKALSEGKAVL